MQPPERTIGFRHGIQYAVTWLHHLAFEMNDPWAKAILNCAAANLGVEGKNQTIDAKAKLLEIALARAAAGVEVMNGTTSTEASRPIDIEDVKAWLSDTNGNAK